MKSIQLNDNGKQFSSISSINILTKDTIDNYKINSAIYFRIDDNTVVFNINYDEIIIFTSIKYIHYVIKQIKINNRPLYFILIDNEEIDDLVIDYDANELNIAILKIKPLGDKSLVYIENGVEKYTN